MSLLFGRGPDDERISAPPLAMDAGAHGGLPQQTALSARLTSRIPEAWIGMTGYLVAGVFLGLVLILALSLARRDDSKDAGAVITDNVVRVPASELSKTCWTGITKPGPARVTVSMEVGLDGKVRSAVATGETPAMRGCVEAQVKAWAFLPQAQAQAMVLPFEIERR